VLAGRPEIDRLDAATATLSCISAIALALRITDVGFRTVVEFIKTPCEHCSLQVAATSA
jgi:hypothetical protein